MSSGTVWNNFADKAVIGRYRGSSFRRLKSSHPGLITQQTNHVQRVIDSPMWLMSDWIDLAHSSVGSRMVIVHHVMPG